MKITLSQIDTTVADIEGNLSKILNAVTDAKNKQSDIIIFPELTLPGYPPNDLFLKTEFLDAVDKALDLIKQESDGIMIVVGSVERNKSPQGKAIFNSLYIFNNNKELGSYRKILLPTYDVFDEERYFQSGTNLLITDYKSRRIAFTICEDIWFQRSQGNQFIYKYDPLSFLKGHTFDMLINCSASPFEDNKIQTRYNLLSSLTRDLGVSVFYCNLVGGNDDLIFDGRSFAILNENNLAIAKSFEDDQFTIDLSSNQQLLNRLPDYSSLQDRISALTLGLKDYLAKTGFTHIILGLSGGIDSALTLVLAQMALGSDKVKAYLLPGPYSSQGSIDDSIELCRNLSVSYEEISINQVFETAIESLMPHFNGKQPDLTEENMQARLRGLFLMSLSNKFGSLLLTTGNKSELSVGYATLYGDMNGALSLVGDLYKTEVYELANYINNDRKIIPQSIITKAPSAELRPEQKDSDSLPDYPILDGILKLFIDDNASKQEIIDQGFDKETVERVISMVYKSEYKRYQTPPILKVSRKAFGRGRRFPIAAKFRW